MSRNSEFRRIRKRKTKLIITAMTVVLAVICVLIGIGYKRLFNNPGNIDTSEIATYEYEEVFSDEYGAAGGGTLLGGEATRHKVTIIETPGAGGVTTQSTYVSDGGFLELNVTSINTGYVFEGWYEDGRKLSDDQKYVLQNITKDRMILARFSTEYITVTTNALELTSGSLGQDDQQFRSIGGGLISPGGTYVLSEDNVYFLSATKNIDHGSESLYQLIGFMLEPSDGGDKQYLNLGDGDSGELSLRCIKGHDPEFQLNNVYTDRDATLTAVYQKRSFTVTITMFPSAGTVGIGDDYDDAKYASQTKQYNVSGDDQGIDLFALLQRDTIQVYDGSTYNDVLRYTVDNVYKVDNKNNTMSPTEYVEIHGQGDDKDDYDMVIVHASDTIYAYNTEDLYYLVKLKAADAHDTANFGAVGVPVPSCGGQVSGGGSSTLSSNYQLTATPNAGYEFSRWEWMDGGTSYSSTDNPIVVKPSGYIYYRAIFVPKAYTVSLSGITPPGSALIEGLGSYGVDEKGVAKANITINPLSGYELDSVSYTKNGVTYNLGNPELAYGKYSINITDIDGDVVLNIKMKKTSGVRVTATVDVEDPAASLDDNYVSITNPTDPSADRTDSTILTVHHDMSSEEDVVTLTAFSGTGYFVKQWIDSRGNVYTNNNTDKSAPFAINVSAKNLTDDITYTAQFEKDTYPIKVGVDDTTNGSIEKVTIKGTSTTLSPDSSGVVQVPSGTSISITAKTASGYKVKYWTNGSGVRIEGEHLVGGAMDGTDTCVLTLNNVTWSDTYVAHIVKASIDVTISPEPDGGGKVQLDDNEPVDVETSYHMLEDGADILLKAFPADGYKFVRWETWLKSDSTKKVSYAEPFISILNVPEDLVCAAVFSENTYTIKGVPSPTEAGSVTVNGRTGEAIFSLGETAVLEAKSNNDLGYRFDYWTDSSGIRYNDNPHEMIVDADDTYTAHFVKGIISITVDVMPLNGGRLKVNGNDFAPGTKIPVESGENLTLSAEPLNGFQFVRWETKGESGQKPVAYADKEIQLLNVTQSETYTAVFSNELYTIKVVSSPVAGGTTTASGKINEATYEPGDQATLEATPAAGYIFDYWTDSAGNKYSQNPYVIPSVQGNDTFTAHYIPGELAITLDCTPQEAGVLKFNGTEVTPGVANAVVAGANATLTAEPKKGYTFIRWESMGESGQNPVAYADKEIQILNITKSETYTAVFAKDSYTIKVVSSPVAGGSATADGKSDEAVYAPGDSATLEATPSAGYRFDYWTDSAGNKYSDNPYVITNVQGNDTFTAHFVLGKIAITLDSSPEGAGELRLNGKKVTEGAVNEVESGANLILSAEPRSGYKFVRWESKGESGQTPVAYADREMQVLNVTQSETYTAIFSDDVYTIKVVSSPIAGGTTTANGRIDEAHYAPGDKAILKAEPSKGYRFDYWTDSAGKRYTENPYVISKVEGSDTFTAHYVMGKLSITIDAAPSDAGVVRLNGRVVGNGSTHEVESGTNITLTAEVTDESRYQFERWESSKGTVSTTNPLQIINITESDTYTAVFNIKTGKHGIKVIASPASGGQATKTISRDGGSAYLKAIPRPGYEFVEWRKEDFVISKKPICIVTDLTDGTTYIAVFVKTHDVDVRSDIIREHFYNDKRIFTMPSYAITRDTMEADAKARIEEARGNHYKNSAPGLKQYKAVSDAERIYDDIELLEDRSVVMIDGELITTDGELMPTTNVDDRSKEDTAAKEFTLKKYGKRYTYEIVTCKDVSVPDGFEDGTRTYIWKHQEVQEKDNIYILYELNGGKMDWVSCTIDEGDSIKFTLDSIGTGARMTIVKVNIE